MKKNLNKLIIGLVFVLIVTAGIAVKTTDEDVSDDEKEFESDIKMEIPEDYVISQSINILINKDNYIHTDETIVIGTLQDIVYAGERINRFIIESNSEKKIEILYNNLDLISTEIIKTSKENGLDEVRLIFRTGGEVILAENSEVKLYKTVEGFWSLDDREHQRSDEINFVGVVEDFEFLPSAEQEGQIYINSVLVTSGDGDTVKVYPYNLETKTIKSDGEMTVYYIGDALKTQVFDIEESDNFSLTIRTENGDYVFEKGEEIQLKKLSSKGYWEVANEIDTTRYEASIESFEFGHNGGDITSLDYINLVTNGEEKIRLTMMQTQAEYAIPYGNYRKIYTYFAHDKLLTDIVPMDDWRVNLYYESDKVVEFNIGTVVWVYKNQDNIWMIDYLYEDEKENVEG